jgi:hypothetical protein
MMDAQWISVDAPLTGDANAIDGYSSEWSERILSGAAVAETAVP